MSDELIMKDELQKIGAALRWRRVRADRTQEEIAGELGCTARTLNKIEHGEYMPALGRRLASDRGQFTLMEDYAALYFNNVPEAIHEGGNLQKLKAAYTGHEQEIGKAIFAVRSLTHDMREFSVLSDVSTTQLSGIENGKPGISFETVLKAATALDPDAVKRGNFDELLSIAKSTEEGKISRVYPLHPGPRGGKGGRGR
jgi:transcriptional regulator with XRE-family HTH domain